MCKQMYLGNSHLQTLCVVANILSNKVYLLISIKVFVFKFPDVFLLLKEKILMPDLMEMNQSVRYIQDNKSTAITKAVQKCGFCLI